MSISVANLVLSTGISYRNVRELKTSNLNLQNRILYLFDIKSYKSQILYLNKSFVKVLNEWLRSTKFPSESPLFPNKLGGSMSLNFCKLAFILYTRGRVEVFFDIHRHTYARDLLKAGINPVIIKELLSHHSFEAISFN